MSRLNKLICTAIATASVLLSGCGKQMPVGAAALGAPGYRVAEAAGTQVPQGFLWGVSTAGYQWEGQDTTSQWAAWDKAGKTSERNVLGANGLVDYGTDMELTHDLGCNAFRTSIEWSRIEPQEGHIDPAAVATYHAMFQKMHAEGLTPVITLHHFTHPQWFSWEDDDAPQKFARYAAFVAKEFGSEIDTYLTFNEPNVYISGGWLAGALPPGKHNPIAAYEVMKHMIKAHQLAYKAIHTNDPVSRVSFNWYTAEWALRGVMAAQTMEEQSVLSQNFMLDQVASGKERTIDFVSFDYYCKLKISQIVNLPRPDQWEVYPEGLYNALKRFYNRYHLPILIAENGLATWDGAPRKDGWTRASYMVAHVAQMQRAMAEGVPVLGYIHWSITDNYEWGSFGPRFGLYTVDCRHQDFRRVPTDGVAAFKAITAEGGASKALLARFQPKKPLVAPVGDSGMVAAN